MKSENLPIVGSFNNQRVTSLDCERSVNCFQYNDPLSKRGKSLIGTSGLINQVISYSGESSDAVFRAQFEFKGFRYDVVGSGVFRFSATGTYSRIGTLTTTVSFVNITANTFQVIFVDGTKGYIWDTIAQTFRQITDSFFPVKPIDVTYLDGFFIVGNGETNNFQLSLFNQGMVWGGGATPIVIVAETTNNTLTLTGVTNANYQTGTSVRIANTGGALPAPLNVDTTYYAIAVSATDINPGVIKLATSYQNAIDNVPIVLTTAGTGTNTLRSSGQLQQGSITSNPGTIVALRTLHRRLFIFSQNFTEVWENAGIGSNLPFRRNNSLLMQYGLAAIGSVSVSFDIMMFLASDKDGQGSLMLVNGTEPIPSSTKALDFIFSYYANTNVISDCTGFLIKENGLIFYRMNFTAANHTYVMNVSQSNLQEDSGKLWHEEETLDGDRHPAQTHCYYMGKNYVGSYNSPTLYLLDGNTYTNDGESIKRMRIMAPITPEGYQRMCIHRLHIDFLQGSVLLLDKSEQALNLLTEDNYALSTELGEALFIEQTRQFETIKNPVAYLSISKDGGQLYGYRSRGNLGKIGDRTYRTMFRKLGTTKRGQAFVCKLEFYDPVPFVVLGGSWVYDVLPE